MRGSPCHEAPSRWSVTRSSAKLYVRIRSERAPVPRLAPRACHQHTGVLLRAHARPREWSAARLVTLRARRLLLQPLELGRLAYV
jgi:hypothetical protein